LLHHVVWWMDNSFSEDHPASILRLNWCQMRFIMQMREEWI